jgi:hypothetical protein
MDPQNALTSASTSISDVNHFGVRDPRLTRTKSRGPNWMMLLMPVPAGAPELLAVSFDLDMRHLLGVLCV